MRDNERQGIATIIAAISRVPSAPKTYIQTTIAAHADEVWQTK